MLCCLIYNVSKYTKYPNILNIDEKNHNSILNVLKTLFNKFGLDNYVFWKSHRARIKILKDNEICSSKTNFILKLYFI